MTNQLTGVLAPVVTPFDAQFNPDAKRLIAHCQWLIENDVGLSPFGSSSEGNSLSVEEKGEKTMAILLSAKETSELFKQRPKEYEGGYIYVPIAGKTPPPLRLRPHCSGRRNPKEVDR